MPDVQELMKRLREHPDDPQAVDQLAAAIGSNPEAVKAAVEPFLALNVYKDGELGVEWTNHSETQKASPLQVFEPESLQDLVGIMAKARAGDIKTKVKAVATGYSVSDLCTTTGFLVKTDKLCKPLPVDCLDMDWRGKRLFRFEAGMLLKDVNAELEQRGWMVANMPSAVKLSYLGGVMTATHGSGASLGTLASQVRSILMVAGDGKKYRIEPSVGNITNKVAHEALYPDVTVIQDDAWFHSAVVSFGTMGLVYSVTIEAEEYYWLREDRTLSTWTEVKQKLAPKADGSLPDILTENRHYEVLFNPYPTDGDHRALETVRNLIGEPAAPPLPVGARNWLTEMLAAIPISDAVLVQFLNAVPSFSRKAIDMALDGLVNDNVVRPGYELLDLGSPATMDAYAIEIALPWQKVAEAGDRIFELAAQAAQSGEHYHNSPISFRFVAAERHYMAPQYSETGEVSLMIELPILVGTDGGEDMLERIERELYALGGRPHWGLDLDLVVDTGGLLAEMYPKYPKFKEIHGKLDPDGIFDNRTTLRLGLSRPPYQRD